ncbi:CLAVATA3/ESR (CLE)-related protein 41-like [Arachis stenosperma]|uniref:CLAVATA3/ESR (CLE)-related protein 41-like n=1 Tax=Arachis stenosperma TaxID=217475 RepID=UPI0025AC8592|nr:CLAVATA3/ESR (CLE)-related protein 41-like [Arachis stenosperma]
MDIEPFLGSWGWFLLSNCMAESKNSPSSSSQTFVFSKSSHCYFLFQFLAFLFIFLLLFNFSHVPTKSLPSESTISSSYTSLHPQPQKTHHPHNHISHTSSKDAGSREFGADEHEVPSGPNPIQNR